MADKRYRIQHRFWLDGTKPQEDAFSVRLDKLKENREFAPFMRDAIRLLFSLQDGDLSVFAEMFPDAVEVLHQEGAVKERERVQSQQDARLSELKGMITAMNALKESISVASRPELAASNTHNSGNARPLGGAKPLGGLRKLTAPVYDEDDDDLVTVKKAKSTNSTLAFLEQISSLNSTPSSSSKSQ